MIICIVSDVLGKENNGTTIAAMNLIRSLKQKGHEVRVLCPDQDKLSEPGYYVVPILNLGPLNQYVAKNGVSLARPSRKIIRKAFENVDLVHLITPFSLAVASRKVAQEMNIPMTAGFHCQAENFTNHIFMMNSRWVNKLVYRLFYRNIYRHVDAIHYPSQFICDVFENETKPTNHFVISNGVNTVFQRIPTVRPEELKDKFVILFTGRYSKEKSHKVLIEAVALSKYADRIQLIFAGAGPQKTVLEDLSKKRLQIQPIFQFFQREELIKVINYSDLYVHPAEIEIEAIACLEAITCGLVPVIANSARSATRHFAISEKNLFRTNDSIDLARKIDDWIEHPDERKQCSEKYLGYAKKFEHDFCMNQMESMMMEAMVLHEHKTKKVVYFTDELNDDFAGTKIQTKKPDSSFRYNHKNPIWNFFAFIIYRVIAIPFAYLYCKIAFGVKIKNRKVLVPYRKAGFFLYGNHTQSIADAFIPTLVSFPKKAYLIANPDVVSIPGLRQIVQMLGAIPIAGTMGGMKNMMETIEHRNKTGRVIAIYPEAHIWPYYTGIRPFRSTSFAFPIKFGTPSFSFTTTYQERKSIFGKTKPKITVHIEGPFFPDPSLDKNLSKEKLRNQVFASMTKNAQTYNQVRYVEYRRKETESEIENILSESKA